LKTAVKKQKSNCASSAGMYSDFSPMFKKQAGFEGITLAKL
jgi:hypothetical protein